MTMSRIEKTMVVRRAARRVSFGVAFGRMYGPVPILNEACRKRVQGGAERSHGGGEDAGDEDATKARRHLVNRRSLIRTGVWIYDSNPVTGVGWYVFSGTGVASPLMARIISPQQHRRTGRELSALWAKEDKRHG